MQKNKLIIVGAILIAVVGTVFFWQQKLKKDIQNGASGGDSKVQVPAINGVLVDESVAKTRPIAVVIENHGDARPQSGLTDADIVYETLAEGGITRFLAFFQTRAHVKEIGPVRSARPYFNTLADQWGAAYAHVGGSTIALTELSSRVQKKLEDINQYFYGDYFYRSKERSAPHNAYTTTELLRGLMMKKNWEDWLPTKLGEFGITPTSELQTTTTEITAKFFDANYTVVFTYDPSTNSYKRVNGGKPAIDKNNDLQISPMNVLVQFVEDYTVPLETVNGLGLRLDKSGRVVLFSNGIATNGTWQYSNGTTIYTAAGNNGAESQPMKFVPGQTWIILMPKSLTNQVTWK
jgi:hypothetical protein